MKLTCPQCGFKEISLIGDHQYKCQTCRTVFSEEPKSAEYFTWQSLVNALPKQYNLSVDYKRLSATELQAYNDYVQNIKNQAISAGNFDLNLINFAIEVENAYIETKPKVPVIKETNGTCREVVLHFIHDMKPPQFPSAALTIRAAVEKELRDVHKLNLDELKPFERFLRITKNREVSSECAQSWANLNKFLHTNAIVDRLFPSEQAKKNFLLNALELFENNGFIKN